MDFLSVLYLDQGLFSSLKLIESMYTASTSTDSTARQIVLLELIQEGTFEYALMQHKTSTGEKPVLSMYSLQNLEENLSALSGEKPFALRRNFSII